MSSRKDYMKDRLKRCGFTLKQDGTEVVAENIVLGTYRGSIRSIFTTVFKGDTDRLVLKLEKELEQKDEYIKGLEKLLYKYVMQKGA